MLMGERHQQVRLVTLPAPVDGDLVVTVRAVDGAEVTLQLKAVEIGTADEVDDARNGIGPVNGRGAGR